MGLPAHKEPEDVPGNDFFSGDMLGYSGLHYLRRIAAYVAYGKSLPAPGNENNYNKDSVVDSYYNDVTRPKSFFKKLFGAKFSAELPFQHLMLHSDAEGYYLPLDFPYVLFPPESFGIPGGMIGSSQRLLSECNVLAKLLDIPPDLDPDSDEIPDSQGNSKIKWKNYGIETFTCIRLISACQASIKVGAAIVFC